MNKRFGLVVGMALSFFSIHAIAYETSTHQVLERHAISQSVLTQDATLFADLGFYPWGTSGYMDSNGASTFPLTAAAIMDFGVVWEDNEYDYRAFNHFFDPQFNNYAGRGLQFGVNGNPSPDWILEDLHNEVDTYGGNPRTCANRIFANANCPQEFSYKKAQQALFNALTLPDNASRRAAEGQVLQMLGHVTHHIQDMGQPQHTRNDQHTHPIPNTNWNPAWSYYEVRTQGQNSVIDAMLSGTTYPVPSFPTARQFWHTPASTSTVFPQFVGMAEFTAQNFTSYHTQYMGDPLDRTAVGPATGFALPNGFNHDGSKKQIVRMSTPALQDVNGNTIPAGTADFVRGTVYDGYTNTTSQTISLASASMFSVAAPVGSTMVFVENTAIYDAEYPILLPRAVAFSAGMINHFFRGRLNLAPNSSSGNGWWNLTNVSAENMNGTFSVYAEDANANRSRVWTSTLAVAHGASATISFSPPIATKKLIAVFQGQLGIEGDASLASGFYDVAGKVIAYTPPQPQVSVPLTLSLTAGSQFVIPYSTIYADSGSYTCKSNGALFGSGTLSPLSSGNLAFTANWTGPSLVCVVSVSGPGGTASATTTITATAPPPPAAKEIVIVGSSWNPVNRAGSERAFRWSSKTGMQYLRVGLGGLYNVAWGVSPDGQTVVGTTVGIASVQGPWLPVDGCFSASDSCEDLGFQLPDLASFAEVPMEWRAAGNWSAYYLDGNSLNAGIAWLADNNGVAYGEVNGSYFYWNGGPHLSNVAYAPSGPKSADGSITLTSVKGQAAYIQAGATHVLPFASGMQSEAHQVVILP